MGKMPNKNQVQREMMARYGREVHEVSVDYEERRSKKHKRSWLEDQDLEEDDDNLIED